MMQIFPIVLYAGECIYIKTYTCIQTDRHSSHRTHLCGARSRWPKL